MKKILLYSIMLATSYKIDAKKGEKSLLRNIEHDALYMLEPNHDDSQNIDKRAEIKANRHLAKIHDRKKTIERAYVRNEKMMNLYFCDQENI